MASIDRILNSSTYLEASEDLELLQRDELRPVRLQLELYKPELILGEQGVVSTIVVFGSARTPEPEQAQHRLVEAQRAARGAPDDKQAQQALGRAERAVEHGRYYEQAREFAQAGEARRLAQVSREIDAFVASAFGLSESALARLRERAAREPLRSILAPAKAGSRTRRIGVQHYSAGKRYT